MALTFLELTNNLLVAFNEPVLDSSQFIAARNVQARAKSAIQNAINEIVQGDVEWPFLAASNSLSLIQGQNEYSWTSDHGKVDWDSFFILKDGTYNTDNPANLIFIHRDVYYNSHKYADLIAGNDGKNIPRYVYPSHVYGFGVSPSPNKTYTLIYNYWKSPTQLNAYDDETFIPDEWYNVIITGASYYMNLFRGNKEIANSIQSKFESLKKDMYRRLIGNNERVRDTRVIGRYTNER